MFQALPLRQLPDFGRLRALVVGDVIADRTLECEPKGLSREAPVMVLRHKDERLGAGGAANVARNLRALGAEVALLGCVGRDANGRELGALLQAEGVDTSGLELVLDWPTPTKTRLVAAEPRRHPQQVLRVDRDPEGPADGSARERVRARLRAEAARADLVLLSDYGYGLLSSELATTASAIALHGKTVVLDPRRRLEGFAGLSAITPNVGELAALTRRNPSDLAQMPQIARAAAELARVANCVLVTRGNLGMSLFGAGAPAEGASVAASGDGNVTDVSGAGDTAAAVFALSLAAGVDPVDSMRLANLASGVVVMENGAVPCSRTALQAALLAERANAEVALGRQGAPT